MRQKILINQHSAWMPQQQDLKDLKRFTYFHIWGIWRSLDDETNNILFYTL